MPGIVAKLIGLPRWVQALGALVLLLAAFKAWDWWDDRAAVAAYRAKEAAAVATQSAQASEAAADMVETKKAELEKAHDEARRAAARDPDDPLRAGLGELRRQQHADRPPSR